MPELKDLMRDQLETCLYQPVQFHRDAGDPLELELIQISRRGGFDPQRDRRQAFSALFRGPMEPILPQKTYPLKNNAFSNLDMFLVRVGPNP